MAKKTAFNTKVTEIEGNIPSIIGLATNSALTAVENKIPDARIKKISDRDTKNKSKHLLVGNELKK